jgi:hypothetical protein
MDTWQDKNLYARHYRECARISNYHGYNDDAEWNAP